MSSIVKVIEILGPGCARCQQADRIVRQVVQESGLDCRVEKITEVDRMVELGVLLTPAIALDGKVVVSGRVPTEGEVRGLLGLA